MTHPIEKLLDMKYPLLARTSKEFHDFSKYDWYMAAYNNANSLNTFSDFIDMLFFIGRV